MSFPLNVPSRVELGKKQFLGATDASPPPVPPQGFAPPGLDRVPHKSEPKQVIRGADAILY